MQEREIELTAEELKERLSPDTIKLWEIASELSLIALESRRRGLKAKDVHREGWVTSGDMDVSSSIYSTVSREFPGANILTEQTYSSFIHKDGQDLLIADEIDGTRWYLKGGETWSIALAFAKNSQPKSSVIIQPDMGLTTVAEIGVGAFSQKDGIIKPIEPDPETDLSKCKVGLGAKMANPETRAQIGELAKQVIIQSRGAYIFESSSLELSNLAKGAGLSGYIHPHAPPWDRVPGMIAVRAAGGKATGWLGQDDIYGVGIIAAANPMLYDQIAKLAYKYVR